MKKRESRVYCQLGFTKGLPNYSALRVDVGIELPCDEGDEKVTFKKARNFATARLQQVLKDEESELKAIKRKG